MRYNNKEEQIKELENQKLDIENKIEELKSVETMEGVYKSLFGGNSFFYIDTDCSIEKGPNTYSLNDDKNINLRTSKNQCERDLLRIQWRNLSTYLNDGIEYKFKLGYKNWFVKKNKTIFDWLYYSDIEYDQIYFNSKESIKKAIKIFGEDNIKKMLGV